MTLVVEGLVCFDNVDDGRLLRGHLRALRLPRLRAAASKMLPLSGNCDVAQRANSPPGGLAAAQGPEPEEERQTSAKLHELASIIAGLGETERVLVVSPLKALLHDAQAEMAKLGVTLAILQGGAVEQQAALKSWERGACKGLLSDPDLPALSLSQASAVVFLSPMLTDTQFTQAAGRVVRQGSLHASVRVIVLGAANTIEDEDAEKVARFRAIAERSAPSAASSGA